MINNICENNKTVKTLAPTASTAVKVDSGHNGDNVTYNAAPNHGNNRDGVVQTTYGHGIWYSEIINNANSAGNNAIVHKQQYYNNGNSNNNNNKENSINRNVWLSAGNSDVGREQQIHYSDTNNENDIIIVDIENDDNDAVERQKQQQYYQQQQPRSEPPNIFMNTNMQFSQKQSAICDSVRDVVKNNITCSVNTNTQHIANNGHVNTIESIDNNDEDEGEDEDDSLASMETLSDNVSIWIDGEKHWVAGVDANTTCSELIWALLNYQNSQQSSQQQSPQQHQHAFTIATTIPSTNMDSIATSANYKTNSNQYEKHELQRKQQQLPKVYDKNVLELNLRTSKNECRSNICTGNKPNIQNTANTNNTPTNTISTAITTSSNQSMPINTKENCKVIQSSNLAATTESSSSATPIIPSLAYVSETILPSTLLPLTLPPNIATVSQLATEYVIVKQYHHCEEYLDGSTKVFDVLPSRNDSNKKECELLLRHLGPAPAAYFNNTTPKLSSLISTDKDSGMGSPVGSARSAKFRRRKHKSSQWLAQANTLHPKISRCSANERLMKIILAQDETIQRQLSLLREKERQITKIEEEKHRKRERELGKNYLLETYLNGLDEAECEPETQDGVEIFIDEPCHRGATTQTITSILNPRTDITPSAVTLASVAVTVKKPLATEVLNMMAKHKLKDNEVRKEKKKKRHKEKQTKDEEIQIKEHNLKTNKNNDKEKVEIQQRQQHESKARSGNNINDNEQEIELQVFWLEKIYTLNKHLQKEEELAAKLHAKVRKHQLRKAQQTQREVQIEIDKLDNNLALQCGDIRKVEANLMQTNEQLQKKLFILERLSIEFLQEEQEKEAYSKQDDIKVNIEKQTLSMYGKKGIENPVKNTDTLGNVLEKSMDIQKLSLNNIKSKEEVIQLEKIIAKPNIDLQPENAKLKETKQVVNVVAETVTNNLTAVNTKSSLFQTNERFSKVTSASTYPSVIFTTTHHNNQQNPHHYYQHHHEELATPPATALSVAGHTSNNEETNSYDTESTSCMFIDKNMLSSLHVQNAKTIKKQMFHTQTTATSSASTTSSQILAPTQPSPISSGFPKRQFQQTAQQHMPMTSTFLTSRPQISHQIQSTNTGLVQQPSTTSASCSSHLTSTTSLPLPSASATASVFRAQYPPTSTSPSPSIMAMNTVDISQLGTLV